MAMRSVSAFRFTLLVLTLAATLLPSPVQARDGRVLVGSKPLAHTFRSKKGVRYYPLAEVCKAFSIPTTAVPKEHLLTIESPLAGKVHLLLAKGEAQVGGKVVRLDPAPIERDRVWFVPEHFVAGTLGIVGESTKGGPDVSLAARAHVAEGPQGLQLIAAAPLIAKGFYLDNPPRYVLDLPNCILDRRYAAPFVSTEPGYSAIRVGQFSAAPFVTRVVYDLTSNGFRPDAAKAKGASRLRLGAARPDTLFPSFKVTIGLAPDGGAVVVEGLLATDATLERNDEGTLAVLFSRAHL
ncbi:MAG TPA: AMIN domain-containing protein, partial [bacterium]|nr:AMIN domain-containing protein [bacterium]